MLDVCTIRLRSATPCCQHYASKIIPAGQRPGLIFHFFDYSNNSMAITITYCGCMSVRLKRGLLQAGIQEVTPNVPMTVGNEHPTLFSVFIVNHGSLFRFLLLAIYDLLFTIYGFTCRTPLLGPGPGRSL
jgi:hypothetical protein